MAIVAVADKEVEQLKIDLRNATNALYKSIACNKAILNNLDNISGIKQALKYNDSNEAQMLWDEIDTKDQLDLMIAPTKGGAFTTKERALVNEFWRISVDELESARNYQHKRIE